MVVEKLDNGAAYISDGDDNGGVGFYNNLWLYL